MTAKNGFFILENLTYSAQPDSLQRIVLSTNAIDFSRSSNKIYLKNTSSLLNSESLEISINISIRNCRIGEALSKSGT